MDPRRLVHVAVTAAALCAPGVGQAAVLHDQLNGDATSGSPTQVSSEKGNLAVALAADDFVVPDGRRWTVQRVLARGGATSLDPNPPSSYDVYIFKNAGTVPEETAIYSKTSLPPGTTPASPALNLNPPAVLEAGRYWVAVQGNVMPGSFSAWQWRARTSSFGNAAAFRSPNPLIGCTTWTSRPGNCGFGSDNPDQVFKLEGIETGPSAATLPGAGGGAGNLGAADSSAPAFRGRAFASPHAFAVNRAGAAETPVTGAAVRRGTEFVYSLSEPARVTFRIQRKSAGRRVGRRCRKPTRRNKSRRRCSRYVGSGAFRVQGGTGANRKPFSGKIGRRSLRPGRYRALLVATDAAGNRSKAKRVAFRVVRARRR